MEKLKSVNYHANAQIRMGMFELSRNFFPSYYKMSSLRDPVSQGIGTGVQWGSIVHREDPGFFRWNPKLVYCSKYCFENNIFNAFL